MSMITQVGSFRGVVLEHAVTATKGDKPLPQLAVKMRALEVYDAAEKTWIDYQAEVECEITGYLCLFSKDGSPIFHVTDIQRVFEWDGASLVGLNELDLEGAEVQFEVTTNTYKDKTRLQVARISEYNDVPGSGGVKKMDDDDLAKLNAKFRNALKKLSGGPKAASAPKPATPPAAPAKTKTKTTKTKKTTPPPAPTPEAAEAAATKPEVPVEEAVEEFAKSTAPTAPKAPPAAPKAASTTKTDVSYTYESAWAECCEKRQENVADDALAAAFTAAMYRVAPGKTETQIESSDWGLITEAVVAEVGAF